MGKTALVTGGSGQIGSHVVDALIDRGYNVVVLDPAPPLTEWAGLIAKDRIVYRHGTTFDIRQILAIEEEYDIDEIYDFGAMLGSEELTSRFDSAIFHNTVGARNVFELAKRTGARVYHINIEFAGYGFTDGYCYDGETEILTENGWKKFKDLKPGEKVYAFNENGEAVLVEPLDYYVADYEGWMYYYEGERMSFAVTPRHRMFVAFATQKDARKFRLVEMRELEGKQFFVTVRMKWRGEKTEHFVLPGVKVEWRCGRERKARRKIVFPERRLPMRAWLRFLGYWLGDGSLEAGRYVRFTQRKKDVLKKIVRVVEELGLPYYVGGERVTVYSAHIARWLKENAVCGELPRGKKKPYAYAKCVPKFVKMLSPDLIEEFLDAYFEADGTRGDGRGRTFITASKRLADDVQELLLKIGRNAGVRRDADGLYRVHEFLEQDLKIDSAKVRKRWYRGKIYSVTVPPPHVIMVRRNGRAMWSGNSVTKEMALRVAKEYAKKYGVFIVSSYVHHVFCERQKLLPARKILPTLISYAVTGSKFRIFGNPNKVMDMLYARDFAEVVIDLLNHPEVETVDKHVYDIGVGYGIKLVDLVEMVYKEVGREPNYVVMEDIRKQSSSPYRVSTNDWEKLLGKRNLRGIKEMLGYVIGKYLEKYDLKDFRLAVEVYEQRHRFDQTGV